MHVWGRTPERPDALTLGEIDDIQDAIEEWVATTNEQLDNPQQGLRAIHVGGSPEEALFEIAVITDSPLSETARTELMGLRDVVHLLHLMWETQDNGVTDEWVPSKHEAAYPIPDKKFRKIMEMLDEEEPLVNIAKMLAASDAE